MIARLIFNVNLLLHEDKFEVTKHFTFGFFEKTVLYLQFCDVNCKSVNISTTDDKMPTRTKFLNFQKIFLKLDWSTSYFINRWFDLAGLRYKIGTNSINEFFM